MFDSLLDLQIAKELSRNFGNVRLRHLDVVGSMSKTSKSKILKAFKLYENITETNFLDLQPSLKYTGFSKNSFYKKQCPIKGFTKFEVDGSESKCLYGHNTSNCPELNTCYLMGYCLMKTSVDLSGLKASK